MSAIARDDTLLLVRRGDPGQHGLATLPIAPLRAGEALFRIERFGLSSNNVTYAALGETFHYNRFFPVPDPVRGRDWACLPAWGIARVVASEVDALPVGERVYGYFPAAGHCTLAPAAPTPGGFRVERAQIPPAFAFYNLYSRCATDPFHVVANEALMVVLRPLFLTGFLIADYLKLHEGFGAATVLVSSAASKTAFGAAWALRAAGGMRVLGLASPRSRALAQAFGLYDEVLEYDALDALPADVPLVYVDLAGSTDLRARLHARLGAKLALALSVGQTHWQQGHYGASGDAPMPSEVFFAPGWIARRRKEAGAPFLAAMLDGWHRQFDAAARHFPVREAFGAQAVAREYDALARGVSDPSRAPVLSFHDSDPTQLP